MHAKAENYGDDGEALKGIIAKNGGTRAVSRRENMTTEARDAFIRRIH